MIEYTWAVDRFSTFLGSGLLAELSSSDGMTQSEAEAWITKKAGREFDPGAMYKLLWTDQEDPKTWGGYTDLRIHIMSDRELNELERDHRRHNKMPPRRPWEPHMFQSAMGRSER